MSNAEFEKFRDLSENSPLEGPIRGFNRYDRDNFANPELRSKVLHARMPEIVAFAEDRKIDPGVVAGVVEASMRLGRIPDLGMYGLAGDEALAVKDFLASAMLGLESELDFGLPLLSEDADKYQKHRSYSDHYRKLSDHHKKAVDHYGNMARQANKEGKPFTAAQHQHKAEQYRKLYSSHAALCDYHDCEANRHKPGDLPAAPSDVPEGAGPTKVDQPRGVPSKPAHPKPGSTASQYARMPSDKPSLEQDETSEQTTSASLAPFMKLSSAFIKRPDSNRWEKEGKKKKDPKWVRREESREGRDGFFKTTTMLEDMLAEAKKDSKKRDSKKKGKKKSDGASKDKALGHKVDPDKVSETFANAKMASLYQHLGHKIDHAAAKVKGGKVGSEWADKLYKACLDKGGSAASDEVLRLSLTEPWLRDQGFVDEASNLRRRWETMMSAETEENASRASPTNPQPAIFTINRMIDIAQGKGSIY